MQVMLMAKSNSALQHFDLAGNSLTVTQANLNSPNLTIDKNVPTVTNLSLYSNNSNSSLAKAGDLINITLEASEQIYNATLQIFGAEIDMTESNNTAYANITVLQNSPNELVTFNIMAYDMAGNTFTVTQDDASANVMIDTVNPESSNLTIYSDNHNTSLATLDNTLNITITVNENLSSANITILDATYTMSITDMMANASVTVDASHADGQVEFSITALDLAGNSLTVTQANLNSPNITIDQNVPDATNLSLYSNNSDPSLAKAGDLIHITLEASEQIYNATLQIFGAEIDMTESNNTAYANITVLQNSPNELVTFNIMAYDMAGNTFTVTQDDASANVMIDTVPPESSNLTIYSDNHNPSLATLGDTLNIAITANEPIKDATITILDFPQVMSVNGAVASIDVDVSKDSTEGNVSFNIVAFDLAGNSFVVDQTNLFSSNVMIDRTTPEVQYLNVTSNNSEPEIAIAGDTITVTLQASEQIENSTLQILNDNIAMTINNDIASATVTVLQNSPNGPLEFSITAYDKTGNILNVTQDNIDLLGYC